MQGPSSYNNVIANTVVIAGNNGGWFLYSGTPGPGNAPIAYATSGSTDPYGNTVIPGAIASVSGTQLIELISGALIMNIGGTLTGTIQSTSAGIMSLQVPGTTLSGQLDILSDKNASGPLTWVRQPVKINTPGQNTIEGWHTVTNPAGFTGTIRVKQLAEGVFGYLDVDLSLTSSSTTQTTNNAGNVPNSNYWPASTRQYPLSVNQNYTTVANGSPRVSISSAGAVAIIMPGFVTAGIAVTVSGGIMYPLD